MELRQFIVETIVDYLNEDKYQDPTYRRLMDIYDIPVDFMWQYREFDRCGDDNLWGDDYIEQLTADIKENGIKTPIQLNIDHRMGLITEGNHRLCIAIKLGFKTIPVRVVSKPLGSKNKHKAKPIDYNREMWSRGMFD